MNPTGIRALIVIGTVLVLGALNTAIAGKERTKRNGEVVYLLLAPVDPRSLMQGDYMTLRFELAQELERGSRGGASVAAPAPREGETRFAEVALDAKRVARLAATEAAVRIKLRYRIRNGHVWLGTNAFFFEEGRAQRFNGARYGEFRVDRESGEAVLVGLRNEALGAL